MIKKITLLCLISFFVFQLNAQSQKCASMNIYEQRAINNPELIQFRNQIEAQTQSWIAEHAEMPKTRNVITIPVVVHVVYRTATENVSDAQIMGQIAALNEDFRLLNVDSLPDTHPFWQFTSDAQIEFCLAQRDPQGNPTNGITRTQTTVTSFQGNDEEKFSTSGGKNNWNPTKYLNMWVCNLTGGLLGYATFPSDLVNFPAYDGVVINYKAFGYSGTATAPNDYGRTATHEIGHWLNLYHIWGDEACGNDLVSDTKVAEDANYGCPNFPHNINSTCGASNTGEMYMNYMDYVDDACMVMFTAGQSVRMRSALNGTRAGLLTSLGCVPPSTDMNELLNETSFEIYPNPTEDKFVVNSIYNNTKSIELYSILGEKIKTFENIQSFPFEIDVKELNFGTYFVQFNQGQQKMTKKLVITK